MMIITHWHVWTRKTETERERNIQKDSKENGERRSYEKGLNADAFSSKINTNSCQNIHNKKNYHTPKNMIKEMIQLNELQRKSDAKLLKNI